MTRRKPPPGMTKQGVRDLDTPEYRKRHMASAFAPPHPPVSTETQEEWEKKREIVDLLYFALSAEDKEEIISLWPNSAFEPTYDFIHEWRTEVKISGCSTLAWYRFLVRSGMARASLAFQISMIEDMPIIEAAMDSECPGWRTRSERESKRPRKTDEDRP